MHKEKPYIIDLGQAVLIDHPKSIEFLKRDINNIVRYFTKYNIKSDQDLIFKDITKN